MLRAQYPQAVHKTHRKCLHGYCLPGPQCIDLWQWCLPQLSIHQLQHAGCADAACIAVGVTQSRWGGHPAVLLDPAIQQLAALHGREHVHGKGQQ